MSDVQNNGNANVPPEAGSSPEDVLAEAAEYGVDLSQLRERLKLTPTERWEQHQAGLRFALHLQKAGAEHRRN